MDVENTARLDDLFAGLVRAMDSVAGLPAVATLDWCDRAARAAAALAEPSVAVVTIGTLGRDGLLRTHQASGVAVGADQNGAQKAKPIAGSTSSSRLGFRGEDGRVSALRVRAPRVQRLGLDLSADMDEPIGSEPPVRVARLTDLDPTAAVDLRVVWDNLEAGDVLLGLAPIGGGSPNRVVFVQVAAAAADGGYSPAHVRALAALLPALAARAELALGSEPTEDTRWLTQREQIVLEHLTLGKSVRQIAEDLGRSPHTVHDHVKGLHRKLGASSRGELIARALGYLTAEVKPVAGTPAAEITRGGEVPSAIEPKPEIKSESRLKSSSESATDAGR
ncbi:MAG: LuxR C-terminal-related transcriptional regulator [Planctomycetota bacterium]